MKFKTVHDTLCGNIIVYFFVRFKLSFAYFNIIKISFFFKNCVFRVKQYIIVQNIVCCYFPH